MSQAPVWRRRTGTAPNRIDFLVQEPAEVYLAKAKEYLTSHQLANFRKSPLWYRRKQLGLVPEHTSTEAVLGQATHTLVLEGRQEFDRRFAIGGPINPRTDKAFGSNTKAYKQWAQSQGKPVLTDESAAQVEAMYASVQAHPLAMELLAGGQAEGVLRQNYRGVDCQARIDCFNPAKGIADLKTCKDLFGFQTEAKANGYFHQLAFYRALISLVTGELVPIFLIAVERYEPFRCAVWEVKPDVLAAAQRENEAAIDHLVHCRQLDSWPTGTEELRVFEHF